MLSLFVLWVGFFGDLDIFILLSLLLDLFSSSMFVFGFKFGVFFWWWDFNKLYSGVEGFLFGVGIWGVRGVGILLFVFDISFFFMVMGVGLGLGIGRLLGVCFFRCCFVLLLFFFIMLFRLFCMFFMFVCLVFCKVCTVFLIFRFTFLLLFLFLLFELFDFRESDVSFLDRSFRLIFFSGELILLFCSLLVLENNLFLL